MKINYIILALTCFYSTLADQSLQCGDWDAYKDEKCIKVFYKKELKNYLDAKNTCYQNEGSVLLSIRSQEEQDFVYNLLHNVHKIVNDVWIGGQYSDKMFKWSDNTTVNYTNWLNNFPRNESGYDCVEMSMDATFYGKWLNEPCDKINVVVCQKEQNWLFSYLQKTVMELRESLGNLTTDLKSTIFELEKTKYELESTKIKLNKTEKDMSQVSQNLVELSQKLTDTLPAGTVAYFAKTSVPIGWLKSNGQSVSRITYSNLFSVIGTTFGSGDGSTTFVLPDLRGEFIRGWSDGRDVDKGRTFGSFQWGSNIPFIDGVNSSGWRAVASGNQNYWQFAGKNFDNGYEYYLPSSQTRDGIQLPKPEETIAHYVDAPNTGVVTNWNLLKGTRPRNIALLACIKY